jgi:hypothetical protein
MTGSSSLPQQSTVRRRTAGWVVAGGLAVLAAATALALSWRDELPDPVASHWDIDGRADGFSSLNAILAVMLGFGVAFVLGFGALTLVLGQSAVTRRLGAGLTIWSAMFFSSLTLGTLYVQRGLADAREAGGIGGALLTAMAGSLLLAVVVGALVPDDPRLPTSDPVPADAPRVGLASGEHTAWVARTGAGPVFGVGILATAALLALVVVTRIWPLLVVGALIVIVVVAMCWWVVRVDRTGLTIRSTTGWPRIHVPLDEVVRADVIEVRPLRDFGGWGLRVGRHGRVGVVLRSGQALLVQRTGGRSVAVTVDDAATAAGLLNAHADHARQPA